MVTGLLGCFPLPLDSSSSELTHPVSSVADATVDVDVADVVGQKLWPPLFHEGRPVELVWN